MTRCIVCTCRRRLSDRSTVPFQPSRTILVFDFYIFLMQEKKFVFLYRFLMFFVEQYYLSLITAIYVIIFSKYLKLLFSRKMNNIKIHFFNITIRE